MTPQVSLDDLRQFPAFAELPADQLQWLLDRCEYHSGEFLGHAGDPANHMFMILEGDFIVRNDATGEAVFQARKGTISGALPFSRITHYPNPVRANSFIRMAAIHRDHFPAMYLAVPDVIPKLVAILTDRVRETARATTQTGKLAAIGKLSAGLAHELNNPAAAARQASTSAWQIFDCYRDTLDQLANRGANSEVYEQVRNLEAKASVAVLDPKPIDSLTRSDLEESIVAWLESIGIAEPWHIASAFVNAGFNVDSLNRATATFSPEIRELALRRVAAAIEHEQVLAQLQNATSCISDLVSAMKEYSFMDRSSTAEIDLNQNLESTLTLFSFRFKSGTQLVRNYSPDLPRICGHGGQLNQVWTNLVDNALDSLEAAKTPQATLTVTTRLEIETALVEIQDNGPGIPANIAARIFDPFFTTKPQGEGTGLGLDTVYRITRQHYGDIRVTSEPGNTVFSIRLPLPKPK